MKVLFYSSLNIDTTFHVDHITKAGETQSSTNVTVGAGGKGSNQCSAFAKALGKNSEHKVYMAGKCGQDGQFIVDKLNSFGVDTSLLIKNAEGTGKAIIQLDKNGQNSIILFGGGNQQIEKCEIDNVLKNFGEGDFLLINCEINNLNYLVNQASLKKMVIVLNPSPVNDVLKTIDISKISYLILNEVEAAALSGVDGNDECALNKLCELYPNCRIVMTLGERGSYYRYASETCHQNIFNTKVVDTTGAGDTFMGYFFASIVKGLTVKDSMEIAAKASATAVSRPGAMDAIPFVEELT